MSDEQTDDRTIPVPVLIEAFFYAGFPWFNTGTDIPPLPLGEE